MEKAPQQTARPPGPEKREDDMEQNITQVKEQYF